jgi:dihydrofolate reductase
MEHDLVDEYRLMINPIVLGSGRRLFREGKATNELRLLDSKTTSKGVLVVSYEPAAR